LSEFEKDVLVVDDEAGVREVLAEILQDGGYVVDVAATLAEAKTLLAQFRYGVVLADWRLPDGDGSVAANLAAAAGSHAFVMSGYLAKMLPGNVDARQTLMKPMMRAELLATVRACIGAAPTRAGA
jgi:DNA-binding response OmpR family regulator